MRVDRQKERLGPMPCAFLAALPRRIGLAMLRGRLLEARVRCPLDRIELTLQQRRAILVSKELRIAHFLSAALIRLAQAFDHGSFADRRFLLRMQRNFALAVPLELTLAEAFAVSQLGLGQGPNDQLLLRL